MIAFLMLITAAAVVDGTACRMNGGVERLIVMTESGERTRVIADSGAPATGDGDRIDRGDLRPGDRVRVEGERGENGTLTAHSIEARTRVADALFDALLPRKTIVGRFGSREAQTEFFSLNTGDGNYIRIDARSAYGPKGRMWVSKFRSGELLEVNGDRDKRGLLKASYINVITDDEPASCRSRARRGEEKSATKEREEAEKRFLDAKE